MTAPELVSVIVPAYNAQATLDETLRSVRGQTHRALEILVIDDGSTDATGKIAARHAAADCRVRVIRQRNAGVAAARNAGYRIAWGDLLAFVDADDLWAPDKIEKQVAALRAAGGSVGLVYTWYARIDHIGCIIDTSYRPTEQGTVIERLCLGNLVGNGSAALVTRAAMEASGGFDPSLRENDAQGCEDWLFYFRVAEHFDFALVAEALTGYRDLPDAMSSNIERMLRSADMVSQLMALSRPALRKTIARGNTDYRGWLLLRTLKQRQWRQALLLFGQIVARDPARLAPIAARIAGIASARWRGYRDRSMETRRAHFSVLDPVSHP